MLAAVVLVVILVVRVLLGVMVVVRVGLVMETPETMGAETLEVEVVAQVTTLMPVGKVGVV
jgi:hypothetical protein